jgi:hypothetical protein
MGRHCVIFFFVYHMNDHKIVTFFFFGFCIIYKTEKQRRSYMEHIIYSFREFTKEYGIPKSVAYSLTYPDGIRVTTQITNITGDSGSQRKQSQRILSDTYRSFVQLYGIPKSVSFTEDAPFGEDALTLTTRV